jgi:ElaB/YqjD/DUF883 family membrane-anchored ribosome-binding protein
MNKGNKLHLVEKATANHGSATINPLDADVERLAAILRQIAFRADDLIHTVRTSGGDRYQDAVRRLERQLRRTQADLEELETGISARAGGALRAMDTAARDHPYAAAAASMLVGAAVVTLMAVVLGRR